MVPVRKTVRPDFARKLDRAMLINQNNASGEFRRKFNGLHFA